MPWHLFILYRKEERETNSSYLQLSNCNFGTFYFFLEYTPKKGVIFDLICSNVRHQTNPTGAQGALNLTLANEN